MWSKSNGRMRKILFSLGNGALVLSLCLGLGCTEKRDPITAKATPPAPERTPSVVEVVGHYAVQIAKGARLATPASRFYGGDTLPSLNSDSTMYILTPGTCTVTATLNAKQQVESVYITARKGPQAERPEVATLPKPERLVRLGELRRVFGEGQIKPAVLRRQEEWRRYPVEFSYFLSPGGRVANIQALMFTPEYSDSAMVHSISLSAQE